MSTAAILDHKQASSTADHTPASAGSLRVAIIGGGIAGLSAAWYLEREARQARLALQYTVLESAARWGGKIHTELIEEGFVVEAGPDSFLTQKPWALQLARELGLGERLLGTNDRLRKVFVLSKGKPVPLPDGVLLIVPTRLMPFALSPLLSPLAKLRMGLDLLIPPKRDGQDETIADFIRRRLGAEALDKIAEPLMSGIYNAEAEKQSLLATFPRFRALEEAHGSLIRGMIAAQKKRPPSSASGQNTTMFMSLRDGMQELVSALVARLRGDLRLNAQVEQIARSEAGAYAVRLGDGTRLEAEVVILATPSYIAASLLRGLAPEAAAGLDVIRYVSTGTLSIAFRRAEVAHPLDGFGLVIPRSEQRAVNAITWTSAKFQHRAPEDAVLLRVFFGGSRRPEMMALDDGDLLATVRGELRDLMGITAEPLFYRAYRWHRANPQYDVGHLERVDAIEAALPDGIYLTGSPYRGIGIPDCVYQSEHTVRRVFETCQQHARKSL
jgi:oxygen-dependent protoporphyrinogen oxidase